MIRRHQHWHSKLSNYFDEVAFKSFRWGEFDCCLFASGAVEAMTGYDIAADFRGKYSDVRGAALALREYGAGTLEKTVTAALGAPLHIAQAKRGDVVSYQGALGICCGTFSRFVGALDESGNPAPATGDDLPSGLIPIPTRVCDQVWSVAW